MRPLPFPCSSFQSLCFLHQKGIEQKCTWLPLPTWEVDLALSSEMPLQPGVQGLKEQPIKEEWKNVRNTNSHMGKDEDSEEEEGGTVEVTPEKVWAYWENTFKARSCFQIQIWSYTTAYGNSILPPAISCACNQITNSTPKNTCEEFQSLTWQPMKYLSLFSVLTFKVFQIDDLYFISNRKWFLAGLCKQKCRLSKGRTYSADSLPHQEGHTLS